MRAWLAEHPVLATWIALSMAVGAGGAVLRGMPLVIAPLVSAAVLSLVLGFDPLPGPLRRDVMPMSLPLLRTLARHRRSNPFYVERVVLRSPFRPGACEHELAHAVARPPWLPRPGATTFIGRVRRGRSLLRRMTWWHNGFRSTAHVIFRDAQPGTEITVQVGAPAVTAWFGAFAALLFGGMAVFALVSTVSAQFARNGIAAALAVLAIAAVVLSVSAVLFVVFARFMFRRGREVTETERVVAFLSKELAADVISRE